LIPGLVAACSVYKGGEQGPRVMIPKKFCLLLTADTCKT
jgi:hypothetical protein